ncbi:MAG: diguanylate cyclase [Gammaproteobacteria bacterium]|nr:diguanylate cyclase [Gammaproteobacteria bacterium]
MNNLVVSLLIIFFTVYSSNVISSINSEIELTDDELSYLKEKKQVKVCVDPDWMPFEKIDKGEHIGMTAEYIAILEQKIGIPIVLQPTTSWVESIEFAKARKCDIYSLAMETEERKNYMNFTKPYLSIPLVVAAKTDQYFIADFSTLKNKKLGVVRGYAFGEILREKHPEMTFVDVDSLHQGLEMVNHGELYGFIGTLVTIGYEFQRNFVGELKIIGKFDDKWELGIATRNDEPLLYSIFEKSIEDISEKQKQNILNQWLAIRYEKVVDYGRLWKWVVALAVILSFLLYRNFLLKKYNSKLEIISVTDKLTQIYNRVKLDEILEQQEALYKRYKQMYSIMIVDIDFFKRVNDEYGHQAGDQVLIEFSMILREHIRKTDILGRWGGEEFIIISPKTNLNDAFVLAEKLRILIQNYSFSSVGSVTASFGLSERNNDKYSTLDEMVSHADQALYTAKKEGRNRVVKYNACKEV